jgi:hypothetical protein
MVQINLSDLARAGGGKRNGSEPEPRITEVYEASKRKPGVADRYPITLTQQPESVRSQLLMLKAETGTTIENLMAEAMNDLFAKYNKPEIAVIKPKKGRAA